MGAGEDFSYEKSSGCEKFSDENFSGWDFMFSRRGVGLRLWGALRFAQRKVALNLGTVFNHDSGIGDIGGDLGGGA